MSEASLVAVARLLLSSREQPGKHSLALRQPAALFDHMAQVMQWAAGRDLSPAAHAAGTSHQTLQDAACWWVRHACLKDGAESLTVMGLERGYTRSQLRTHYRLLIRLTHPDFVATHQGPAPWPSDAAQRVNAANDILLRRLGDADQDTAPPETPRPASERAPSAPVQPVRTQPRKPLNSRPPTQHEEGWWARLTPGWKLGLTSTGAALCGLLLLLANGLPDGSGLVARPAKPPGAESLAAVKPEPPEMMLSMPIQLSHAMAPKAANSPPPPSPSTDGTLVKPASPTVLAGSAQPIPPAGADRATLRPNNTPDNTPDDQLQAGHTKFAWWETVPAAATQEAVIEPAPKPTEASSHGAGTPALGLLPAAATGLPERAPTRLTINDVQPAMANMLQALGLGRAQDAWSMVPAEWRARNDGGDFVRRFDDWLGSMKVLGMGVVTMEAKARQGQLWVDGTLELKVSTPEGREDRRFLPFRTRFEGDPGRAVMVGLALRSTP